MPDRCNICGGPHPSSKCDYKPMRGSKEEEPNYANGGYRGNYYGRNSENWRDRQPRDYNRNSQPREDNPSIPPTTKKKFEESDFEKTMREFIVAQKSSNNFVKNQFFNLKTQVKQGQKNHQAVIQDLETNGKTYDPPDNPNANTTVINDDDEDDADKTEKEGEQPSSKQTKINPPPLKVYKLRIPYPQRLRKENMEERYAKFIDLIKEVKINLPLIDVLAGMPNYGKFIKDLVSNKSKIDQIFAAVLNKECSAIVQNKLPPKLGDPGSFLIPCTFANSVECLALANLSASMNLIPYSLYASLSENTLKPIKMSIRLANRTYQYPMGVAENMLVQVGKFVFPVDFVILQMEEHDKVPLILGRPFLHTADAIIRFKNKELNLGVGDDRITFLIDKAMQHSYSNDDTCFRMDELPLEEKLRIKTSIQDLATDLEMKPLPENLEYAFLENDSLLQVVISALLKDDEKKRLIFVLKNHKEAFAWKTSDIPGISSSFCKHKINFEYDAKLVIQIQRRLNPNMKEVVKK
ncbi:reverse transcriptase domain-containing protein [Tanacetum coccineum]|uniref:Reverse transcriptase domain-containing protein n=1 Tax=Tanacetum coccineum TaxID=301880 RepID=A0ABQ5ADY6_9ASTR